MKHLIIATLALLLLAACGAPEAPEPTQETRAYQPVQCEELPWDTWYASGATNYVAEPTQEQLITDYYAQEHNVSVSEITRVERNVAVCEACNVCQASYYYTALTDDPNALERLGWGPVPSEEIAQQGLDGTWNLVSITSGNETINASGSITFEDGSVNGQAPCNTFSGSYETEGDAIGFSPLAATRMACPQLDSEQALFGALDQADSYRFDGEALELRSVNHTVRFVPN